MKTLLLVALLSATPSPPPDATTTVRGLVNTKAQAFSGLKHFDGGIWTPAINGVGVETFTDLNLYISPDGGNAGPCSQAAPCQTLNGALRLVPKKLKHIVRIDAAPGIYPPEWSVIEGLHLLGGSLEVVGSWQSATGIDGGSTTGTLTSVTTTYPFWTLTDSTQTWGTDTVKGKHVRVTPDGGVAVVMSNDATTLTLASWATGKTPAASDTYELLEPAVVFTNDAGSSPSTVTAVAIHNITGNGLISTSALLPDGGPRPIGNRIILSTVEVRPTNTSLFFTVSINDIDGPRVEISDSRVSGNLRLGGNITALSTARSAFICTSSSAAIVSSGTTTLQSWTGGVYARSATSSGLSWLRSTASMSFSQNFVFETGSNTAHGVWVNGGSIWAQASGANPGIVAVCPGSSTSGVGVKLSDTSTFGYGNTFFGTPALTVRGCSRGIEADNGRSEVMIQSYLEHRADGGTPIGITVSRGSKVRITPVPTFTGLSDELRIDGTVVDGGMATLNAATLQVLTGPYGSYISR